MTAAIFAGVGVNIGFKGQVLGSPVTFENLSTNFSGRPSIKLTDTSVFVSYSTGTSGTLRGVVISDVLSSPSVGTDFEINSSGNVQDITIGRLSDTAVAICYRNVASGNDEGVLRVITSLDGTPSVSTATQFNSTNSTTFIDIAILDGTTAGISYRDNSDSNKAKIVKATNLLTTQDISASANLYSGTGNSLGTRCSSLSSTNILTSTIKQSSGGIAGNIVDMSGATPSVGSDFNITTDTVSGQSQDVLSLSTSTGACFFTSSSNNGKLVVLTALDSSPTADSGTVIDNGSGLASHNIGELTTGQLFLTWRNGSTFGNTVDDIFNTPTLGTEFTVSTSASNEPAGEQGGLTVMKSNLVIYTFSDSGDSNRGKLQRIE